jgi:peroxiredoxin
LFRKISNSTPKMHYRLFSFLAVALLAASLALPAASADDDLAKTTLTKVGDLAPAFAGTAITGESLALNQLKGKVVVLSLFATWCGPCNTELPQVEKELWQAFRGRGLVVLAIAREEGADKLRPFAAKLGLTFPLLPDQGRKIFNLFATNYIPRLYVIGTDGRIKFQSVGFDEGEFRTAVAAVERELTASGH